MTRYIPTPVANIGGNPTSAGDTINDNFDDISAVIETLLSRTNVHPNQMTADLDMNHQDILNVDLISASEVSAASLVVNGGDITQSIQDALDAASDAEDAAATAVAAAAGVSGSAAAASASAAAAATSAAAAIVAHITWEGQWVTSTAYQINDAVVNNGSSYIAKTNHTSSGGTQPGVGGSWASNWDLLASIGGTGPTGPTGSQGAAATVAVGTVTTGLPGSQVSFTNVGTSGAAVFNVAIPKGDTGASGAGTGDMVAANNLSELTSKPTARSNLGSTTVGDAVFVATTAAIARTALGAGTGSGSVTSAAMTVPTGLSVSGSPITTTGTFAVTWSGIIPVAQGSTGLASYTVGDLLYADSTSSLAKVAHGTTSQVLIGSTSAPSWGSVSLATMITGTLAVANGGTGQTAFATSSEYRAATTGKWLTADVWSAAATVALTSGATIALNLASGLNFTLTLGTNGTLSNPTNTKVGQTGFIQVTQDGTGSRTLAYGSNYKWANGSVGALSTPAGTIDVLQYEVLTSSSILLSLTPAVA